MASLPAGSFGNLTDNTALKRLSSLRFFPEWEGRLSHAVQNGVASLADLPPRALKAQAQTSFVCPLSPALCCDGTRTADGTLLGRAASAQVVPPHAL